ncbi:MAG: hypothetical protein O9301_15325, partial [Leptospira sp.]|nr:hypothetical protein [Leptospira sp.]
MGIKNLILILALCIGCNDNTSKKENPVVYFEIPVLNMERAVTFYKTVFGFEFKRTQIDKYDMSLFP